MRFRCPNENCVGYDESYTKVAMIKHIEEGCKEKEVVIEDIEDI